MPVVHKDDTGILVIARSSLLLCLAIHDISVGRVMAEALAPLIQPQLKGAAPAPQAWVRSTARRLREGELSLVDAMDQVLRPLRGHSPARHRLLLVVDHFEDLYTLCSDVEARRAFIDLVLQPLEGHTGPVCGVEFSPEGSQILTASWDCTARLWLLPEQSGSAADVRSGQLRHVLHHAGPVHSARFSPDGSRIITASGDRAVRVWDAHTGEDLHTLAAAGWGNRPPRRH